ncbi:ornithine carbamoyltransferase [bacterium]|nr:ornithine carbamoyltransferase [bacterium]
MALTGRDLLSLGDLAPFELAGLLDLAIEQKAEWAAGVRSAPLAGQAIALIFQKPSMRTRVSFEIACSRLGAHPVVLGGNDTVFSRGESIYDSAKVLERYVDCICIRTFEQSLVEEIALHAGVPVVNMLTDEHHPCQGLADLLTIRERFGTLNGVRLAYVGDGNNMAHTYLLGGALSGMDVAIATPSGYEPLETVVEQARAIAATTGANIAVTHDPAAAVEGSHVVATDTWASMGQEGEHDARVLAFAPFSVTPELMSVAASDAIFMHCLPAHRGEEVTDGVIDAQCSVVFDEAENRLHAQKALLTALLG